MNANQDKSDPANIRSLTQRPPASTLGAEPTLMKGRHSVTNHGERKAATNIIGHDDFPGELLKLDLRDEFITLHALHHTTVIGGQKVLPR